MNANSTLSLKTDEALLRELRDGKSPSAVDIREQRVSFVFGSLGSKSTLTREQVKGMLEATR